MRLEPGNEIPIAVDSVEPVAVPKKKHTGLMIAVGVLTIIALAFVWRTVFFYVKISQGDFAPPTTFASTLTLDSSLQGDVPEGEFGATELATDDDPNLGADSDHALLTIVEFADFGCPFSREASYVVRKIAEHTSVVRYVYRDFPILELHENAGWAAEAGECAQEQDRFFDFHDKMFQNQFDLSPDKLKQYAREIGLNGGVFDECLDSGRFRDEVEDDRAAGVAAGVRGTPTFFFNGVRIEGSIPQNIFDTLLNRFDIVNELQD